MPEPRVYTDKRGWGLVRKASDQYEQRDWFSEQVDFANYIDADVDSIIPLGKVYSLAATGSATANGTALRDAYADAKTKSPSATNIINIVLNDGAYDMGGARLDLDTEYINIIGRTPARRHQWVNSPLWTEVDAAGARIYNGEPGFGVLNVTVNNVFLVNLDIANAAWASVLTTQCPASAVEGIAVIGCSIQGTWESRGACQYLFHNTHAENGLGSSGNPQNGVFIKCSSSGGISFYSMGAGSNTALVDQCLILYEQGVGLNNSQHDKVLFRNCRFFTDPAEYLFPIYSGGSDTNDTVFQGCYMDAGFFKTQSPSPASLCRIRDCVIKLAAGQYFIDAGAHLINSTIEKATGGTIVYIKGANSLIHSCRLIGTGGGDAVTLGGPPVGTYHISGNEISNGAAAGAGISVSVPYAGGNNLNGQWVDTGGAASPFEAGAGTNSAKTVGGSNLADGDYSFAEGQNIELDAEADYTAARGRNHKAWNASFGDMAGDANMLGFTSQDDGTFHLQFVKVGSDVTVTFAGGVGFSNYRSRPLLGAQVRITGTVSNDGVFTITQQNAFGTVTYVNAGGANETTSIGAKAAIESPNFGDSADNNRIAGANSRIIACNNADVIGDGCVVVDAPGGKASGTLAANHLWGAEVHSNGFIILGHTTIGLASLIRRVLHNARTTTTGWVSASIGPTTYNRRLRLKPYKAYRVKSEIVAKFRTASGTPQMKVWTLIAAVQTDNTSPNPSVTILGQTKTVEFASAVGGEASWDVQFVASSPNLDLQVQGALGEDVLWAANTEAVEVGDY